MIKTEKQKFLFRCKECGAEFFFYMDEILDDDNSTNDEKLWCVSCIKRGTLVRVEKVENGFVPRNY